jgi:hypothetical protein
VNGETAKKARTWGVFLAGVLAGVALTAGRTWSNDAHAQDAKLPFASSVEQRQQNVEELRKLNALMQKQLDLLTSGRVRVVVVEDRGDTGKR